MHSVQKCIEYYFDADLDKDSIYSEVQKNINELKKISKIKDVSIEINQNEWGVKIAKVFLNQEPTYFQLFTKALKEKSNEIKESKNSSRKYEELQNRRYGTYKQTGKVYRPI